MAFLKVFLCVLSLVLLPGCDTTLSISGEIIEYQVDAEDELTALVIQTEEGDTVGLIPEEGAEHLTFSWLSGDGVSEFRAQYPSVLVSAQCQRKKTTLTRSDGTQVPAYTADWVIDTDRLIQREAYTFQDGVTADLWESWPGYSYRLSDRTELLQVEAANTPENQYVIGLESFDDLPSVAQEKVLAFYEELGVLFDETAELEKAYGFYLADPENFTSLLAGQNVSPSFANDNILSFRTTVTTPLKSQYIDTIQLCHTFDRKTGEQISNYDLFTVPPEELLNTLLEHSGYENWEDAPSVEELQAALKPEYISLSEDYLNVTYPLGTLPSQNTTFGFGVSYFGQEWDVLQPWARPSDSNE